MSKDGSTVVEVGTRISKAQVVYSGLKFLWHRPHMPLRLKGRSVLLHGFETWSMAMGDVRRLEVLRSSHKVEK